MAKIDINDLLKETQEQIKNLALATASKFSTEAIAAGNNLLTAMKTDLEKWSKQLEDKEITEPEFELLVKSYKVEAIVASLEQAGMASVKAAELSMNILNVIIDVSVKLVTKLLNSAV